MVLPEYITLLLLPVPFKPIITRTKMLLLYIQIVYSIVINNFYTYSITSISGKFETFILISIQTNLYKWGFYAYFHPKMQNFWEVCHYMKYFFAIWE